MTEHPDDVAALCERIPLAHYVWCGMQEGTHEAQCDCGFPERMEVVETLERLAAENERLVVWGRATFEAGFQERQRAERAEAEVTRLTHPKSGEYFGPDDGIVSWKDRALKAEQEFVKMLADAAAWQRKYRCEFDRADRAEALAKDEYGIVARIWEIYGNPDYKTLDGKSLYDLIEADKSDLAACRAEAIKWQDECLAMQTERDALRLEIASMRSSDWHKDAMRWRKARSRNVIGRFKLMAWSSEFGRYLDVVDDVADAAIDAAIGGNHEA